ncbi:hypothetical protein BDZ45DRAFT_800888 [Acephala macrosclerotiorum]|nr:hypothetical protein BDZ45DRAFT_800888 [Acephala macrosclerotiorum]
MPSFPPETIIVSGAAAEPVGSYSDTTGNGGPLTQVGWSGIVSSDSECISNCASTANSGLYLETALVVSAVKGAAVKKPIGAATTPVGIIYLYTIVIVPGLEPVVAMSSTSTYAAVSSSATGLTAFTGSSYLSSSSSVVTDSGSSMVSVSSSGSAPSFTLSSSVLLSSSSVLSSSSTLGVMHSSTISSITMISGSAPSSTKTSSSTNISSTSTKASTSSIKKTSSSSVKTSTAITTKVLSSSSVKITGSSTSFKTSTKTSTVVAIPTLPWTSLGCYSDAKCKLKKLAAVATMNSAICQSYAAAALTAKKPTTYHYIALENGKTCLGATTQPTPVMTSLVGAKACTVPCALSPGRTCGGKAMYNLYANVSPTITGSVVTATA